MTPGAWSHYGSQATLYRRVLAALQGSAKLAHQHARREQRGERSDLAADEWKRARRARELVARTRAMLQ
jgi:hypothetical protein